MGDEVLIAHLAVSRGSKPSCLLTRRPHYGPPLDCCQCERGTVVRCPLVQLPLPQPAAPRRAIQPPGISPEWHTHQRPHDGAPVADDVDESSVGEDAHEV